MLFYTIMNNEGMDKFKEGDTVLEKGTQSPIMIVVGRTMKGGLPYTITDSWTCEWTDATGKHRTEKKEENLESVSTKES